LLTTQLYIKGEAMNKTDALYKRIKDNKSRDNVTVQFTPVENHGLKQLAAHFDIVVGFTPKG
jgi:protocatechuate 3,4-dioxygenase beta subunit